MITTRSSRITSITKTLLDAQWKPVGAPTKPASSNTPKTGDALLAWLPSALIVIALATAALTLYSMRRKRMEADR